MYLEAKARELIKEDQVFLAPSLSRRLSYIPVLSPTVIPSRDDTDYPTSLHQSSINKILLRHCLRTISGRKDFNCGSISPDVSNWKTRWAITLTQLQPFIPISNKIRWTKTLTSPLSVYNSQESTVRLFYMHIFILGIDCLPLNSLKL